MAWHQDYGSSPIPGPSPKELRRKPRRNCRKSAKRDELKERSSTPRKSRGGGKVRKVTSRIFRTSAGPRITVEHKRGLDGAMALAALREAVRALEVELDTEDHAAA